MKANKKSNGYLPIEDYGIIGNLQTVALVSLYGSIDYMCFPRFDSPSVFCKLLDTNKGGFFSIIPRMKDVVVKQLYLPDTNILVSRFFSDEGIAEIIDYMPVEENGAIVRRVSTIRGKVKYQLRCAPGLIMLHPNIQLKSATAEFYSLLKIKISHHLCCNRR
jgi:GH15 family glucan-1,4-alpha-glucosidase